MKFSVADYRSVRDRVDLLIVPLFEGEDASGLRLPVRIRRFLDKNVLKKADGFQAKRFSVLTVPVSAGPGIPPLMLIGLGKPEDFSADILARACGKAVRSISMPSMKSAAFLLRKQCVVQRNWQNLAQKVVEGFLLGQYDFRKYKEKSENRESSKLEEVFLVGATQRRRSDVESGIHRGQILSEAVCFARDLANEPANVMTPTRMAEEAQKLATEAGLSCTVLEKAEMEKMGMGALLSVAQGSDHPPKLVILEFKPDKRVESEPVAVIGKGVTFDSGGISLKPARNMDEMKFDMSGAAVVMGVMKAVAALKPSVSVVGVMPLVENLPSGKATKPGDIVKSYSGKTIEIQNTDAEGRLILADAISYVQKSYKPAFLLDLATLTGAVVVALGHAAAGIMGGDGRALEELVEIGNKVGERVWPLPLYDEYADQLKSNVADLRNVGGGPAGVTVGGAFLANFVEDRKKWIHIDIAGVAWTKEDKPLARKGATGFGVRLVVEWIETVAEKRILR